MTDTMQRGRLRDRMTHEVQRAVQQLLNQHGFEQYRQDELLNRETGRLVRTNYASDEWQITVSDMPQGGYNGVARMRWIPRGRIVLDARNFARGAAMPTGEEIVALVRQ
jgi:hypothetical protein